MQSSWTLKLWSFNSPLTNKHTIFCRPIDVLFGHQHQSMKLIQYDNLKSLQIQPHYEVLCVKSEGQGGELLSSLVSDTSTSFKADQPLLQFQPCWASLGLSKVSCVCQLYVPLESLSQIIFDQKQFQFCSSTTTSEYALLVRDQLWTFAPKAEELLLSGGSSTSIYYICILHGFQLSHMHIVLLGSLIFSRHQSEIYCLGSGQQLNSCLILISLQSHVPFFPLPPLLSSDSYISHQILLSYLINVLVAQFSSLSKIIMLNDFIKMKHKNSQLGGIMGDQ